MSYGGIIDDSCSFLTRRTIPYGTNRIVNTACTVTYVPFILCVARLSGSGSGSPPRTNQRAAGALDCCGPRQASPSNADAGMHAGSPWNVNFRFLPPTPYLLSSYRSSSLRPFHLPYPPPARASHSIHLCHSLSVLTPFFYPFLFCFRAILIFLYSIPVLRLHFCHPRNFTVFAYQSRIARCGRVASPPSPNSPGSFVRAKSPSLP